MIRLKKSKLAGFSKYEKKKKMEKKIPKEKNGKKLFIKFFKSKSIFF